MDTDNFSILTISLFRPCEQSFIAALDEAKLPHGRIQSFSTSKYSATITEVISMPTQLMPWGTITAALFSWLKGSDNREILITSENSQTTPASACSPVALKELLMSAVGITVMQTSHSDKKCA